MIMNRMIIAVVAALAAVGCCGEKAGLWPELSGEWNVIEIDGTMVSADSSETKPYIGFSPADSSIFGCAGCNRIVGRIGIDEDATVADFSKTDIRCEWPESQYYPTALYNAMINPLRTMPVAGVFWYQGCANVGRAGQYEICFKNMINGWRKAFGNPSMPFYFVQLAGFMQPVVVQPESEWALLRNAQSKALELPHTDMATAIDLGNPIDIHPTNKAEVARRLTMLALDKTYGMKQKCNTPRCIDSKIGGGYVELTFNDNINIFRIYLK